jgi:hypothetical protein
VGEDLLETFMWMHEAATPAGERIHAYKHIETRCYVHLDLHGHAFVYVDEDRYRPLPLATALELALAAWWEELDPSPEEVASAWSAIARARGAVDGAPSASESE